MLPATSVLVALVIVVSTFPAARVSDRIGRKPVIYASCVMGAAGAMVIAVAPGVEVAELGVVLVALASGAFLAVDWALISDIVPKGSTGRYMGISNVATASAGTVALAVGGAVVMDTVNRIFGYGSGLGPRAALVFGLICYIVGAALLRPIVEKRREDDDGLVEAAS